MKKTKENCNGKDCFLCRWSEPEWLPFIAEHKSNHHIKKGETIFREGDKIEGIYFLFSGKVKVVKRWTDDKELIIRFAKKGEVLGHRGFGHTGIYPVSATALEETTLCFVPDTFFQSSLKMNPALTYQLMLFYSAELQDAELRMRDLVHMDTKGKISDALLMIKHQFGCNRDGFLNIHLSRQDLASFVGTSYETVFRIIQELTAEKSIQLEGKQIRILQEKKLKSYTLPSERKA